MRIHTSAIASVLCVTITIATISYAPRPSHAVVPYIVHLLRQAALMSGRTAGAAAARSKVLRSAASKTSRAFTTYGTKARSVAVAAGRQTAQTAHRTLRGLGSTAKAAAVQTMITAGTAIRLGAYTYVIADIFTSVTEAGYVPHSIPATQAVVLAEIGDALAAKREVYTPKICLDTAMHRFYTVPLATKTCPNGKLPVNGEPIDLVPLKPIAAASN